MELESDFSDGLPVWPFPTLPTHLKFISDSCCTATSFLLLGSVLHGQGSGREAAVCPGSKGGHQHPGLCDQERDQEIKNRIL